jgi:hypothetical protein
VAVGDCVRLAAVVSLALAAARVRDHVDDHDGVVGAVGVRPAARRIAERWVRQGSDAGRSLGFDTSVLVAAMDRQAELEATARPGSSLLLVTEPTETAVAAAFGHTAVLAGRPGNEAPLQEIGRLFGRVAHLLDAVEDCRDDVARGKWNPLAATETSVEAARRLCDDAVLGIELALADVEFTDGRLVRRLLTGEVRRALNRTFGRPGHTSCTNRVIAQGGPQGPINFGNQPLGAGPFPLPGDGPPEAEAEGEPPRRGWCRDGCGECSCGCCEGCCDSCDCDC